MVSWRLSLIEHYPMGYIRIAPEALAAETIAYRSTAFVYCVSYYHIVLEWCNLDSFKKCRKSLNYHFKTLKRIPPDTKISC